MIPDYVKAIGAVLLPNIAGFISGTSNTKESREWYDKLKLPSLNPPKWVFPPVWGSLYSGMGYASYLVWRDGGGFTGNGRIALMAYGGQLVFTLAYCPIFFGQRNIKGGFADIIAATAAASTCGILFFKINPIAGYLFIPYVTWLSFASYLNYCIYKSNPQTKEHK